MFHKKSKIKNKLFVSVELKAQAINAINSYLVYGFPSPFTFWGFAHNVALQLGTKLNEESVLYITHSFQNRIEKDCFSQIKSTQRVKNNKVGTISDLPRADIYTTIVFALEEDEEIIINKSKVKAIVQKSRFSGGTILQNSIKINIEPTEAKLMQSIREKGFLCKEKHIELKEGRELDDFVEILSIKKGKKGWLAPSLLGYLPIDKPEFKKGSRKSYKHQFAEPIIGVTEFYNFNRFENTLSEDGWYLDVSDNLIKIQNKER